MTLYRCSQCKTTYSQHEYLALEKTSRVTDDPKDEYGVETVCECGARFHTDKWQLVEDVDTDEGEITVSTTALTIPHGMHHDQWYETCLFHESGSPVVERYRTEEAAATAHEEIVEQIEADDFSIETTRGGVSLDG